MIRARAPDQRLMVQLGCFDQPAEGWYNADITPHILIARVPGLAHMLFRLGRLSRERYEQHRRGVFRRVRYLDVTKRLPFRDAEVDAFFSSHTLEHLYIFETQRLLRELHRTLKPGGVVRLVLPDLDQALALYDSGDPTAFLKMVFENDRVMLKKNQHRWMFTSSYLVGLLREAGFAEAWTAAYRQTCFEPFLQLDNRPENSLYVEARK